MPEYAAGMDAYAEMRPFPVPGLAGQVGVAETGGLIVGRFDETPHYLVHRPSGAKSWLLMLTEGGAGWASIDDRTPAHLPRGCAALLPPGREHAYYTDAAEASWQFWWVHFHMRRDWLDWFAPGVAATGAVVRGLDDAVVDDASRLFLRLHAAARWPGRGPVPAVAERRRVQPLAAAGAGWAMAAPQVESLLLLLSSARPRPPQPVLDERVAAVLALVSADPAAPHSVASLSRAVALSPSRLAHLCSQQLQRPLMQQVRGIRLTHAAKLLEQTALPVARVARASGFASPFHFSRAFAAQYGMPPSTYRSRTQGG